MERATFEQQRHQLPESLPAGCELVLACPSLRSRVNLSRIARAAGCSGVRRLIVEGPAKLDPKVARDSGEQLLLESHRSLPPVLRKLQQQGYQVVGLEQATGAESLFDFAFLPRTVLLLGHERRGLDDSLLRLVDRVAEIPVFGLPPSHNVATAAALAMYEYCRQMAHRPSISPPSGPSSGPPSSA